jgi:hypothetical protein
MKSVSEVLASLSQQGYTANLSAEKDCLSYGGTPKKRLLPENFQVDQVYRFEGDSNPSDEAVVFAISSTIEDLKGVLVGGYNAYAEALSPQMTRKLSVAADERLGSTEKAS